VLAGAVAFALVRTGAIGGSGSDDAADPGTGSPAVIAITDPPTGSLSPSATASPQPGPPITSPVDVPIMMYHTIGPPDQPANAALAVSATDFAAQMSYLACAGYTPITVQRLFDAFDGKAALPEKPIILTFDDGWVGQYKYGFPVLKQHGFVGSFAIVTGFVEGSGPYMSWAQIAEMSGAGMEMMSHTVSHIDLGTTDDATDIAQLQTSKSTLQTHIGHSVDYFVYPSGEPFRSGTAARQAQVVQMLKDAGYRAALLDNNGYGAQDPAHPYELNRVRVSGGEGIYAYAGSIHGASPDVVSCQ
jgi:peptidoglycan/xylan/chitin deacetylase (PgdA/CDA1 family)